MRSLADGSRLTCMWQHWAGLHVKLNPLIAAVPRCTGSSLPVHCARRMTALADVAIWELFDFI